MSLIATATEQFVIVVARSGGGRWITSATEIQRTTDDVVMTPKETWHLTTEAFSDIGRPCLSVTVCMAHNPDIIVEEWRVPDSNGD